MVVGMPTAEEGATGPPPAASVAQPSFANRPLRTPLPACGTGPEPAPSTTPRAVASVTELARLDPGAGARLLYHPALRELLVAARGSGQAAHTAQAVTLFGDLAGMARLPAPGGTLAGVLPAGRAGGDGANLVVRFTRSTPHLTLLPDWNVVGEAATDAEEPGRAIHIDLRGFELGNVVSMAIHVDAGRAYLLDDGRGIVRLQLPTDALPSGGAPAALDACEIAEPAGTRFMAIAVRQHDGHLFLLTRGGEGDLLHYDADGRYLARHDLGGLPARPRALAFGPTRSPDDADANEHLYLLTAERNGRRSILTVALEAVASAAELRTVRPTLVRTTRTDSWAPSSADPTGIGWDAARELLVVTDSEADEIDTFRDVNLWSVSPRGEVIGTALSRTNEPTDVAVTEDGALYFVTDDGAQVVQVVNPGPDELPGTFDDRLSYISTAAFGSQDPEGIAYGQRSLFIADGAGRRVYRLAAGANGVFDGVSPDGDDEVFSFDVGRLGVTDPEGIAYDPARGTLYILDREQGAPIRETTTGGRLIRTIRLDGLGFSSPSGLAIGPSSDDPGLRSLYVVDRGVDNAVNARQSDGLLFEIRLPAAVARGASAQG
jgi:sugar lactone lactonase YvrE